MLRKRLHIGLLGSLLAAAFVAAVASPASAGTYNVNSCGKSSTGSLSGWTFDATAGAGGWANYFFTAQVCDGDGIYRGFQNVMIPAGAYAAWTFHAPADTYIRKATLY